MEVRHEDMLILKDVWNYNLDMGRQKFLRYGRNFCHMAEISTPEYSK